MLVRKIYCCNNFIIIDNIMNIPNIINFQLYLEKLISDYYQIIININ